MKQDKKLWVVISTGKKIDRIESWKHYTIINELRCFGAMREDAVKAAEWARKAKPGESHAIVCAPPNQPVIALEIVER